MSGDVTWQQLLFIISVILSVSAGVGTLSWLIIWKIWGLISYEREITEKRFMLVQETFKLEHEQFEARIAKIELFNAGLVAMMKQMDEFRLDVKMNFDELRKTRKEDMMNIHRRFDKLFGRGDLG